MLFDTVLLLVCLRKVAWCIGEVEEEAEKARKKREAVEKERREAEEKAQMALLTGKASAQSKIEKAIEEGVDVTEFTERLKQIEALIDEDSEEALNEAKALKDDIDTTIREEQIRRKAAEEVREAERKKFEVESQRLKAEAEAKLRAERERLEAEAETKLEAEKEKLRRDREFISEVRREIISPPIPKVEREKEPLIIKSIDEPMHVISVSLDRETFMKLSNFMKTRGMMVEAAVIYLIEKGLEAIVGDNN